MTDVGDEAPAVKDLPQVVWEHEIFPQVTLATVAAAGTVSKTTRAAAFGGKLWHSKFVSWSPDYCVSPNHVSAGCVDARGKGCKPVTGKLWTELSYF
jgi:hypothetical protein